MIGTAAVVAPPLAFHATLFVMPGLYTTDLFSYVMYSHIAGVLGINPYLVAPNWFPEVRMLHWIHPIWHNARSIYGPAWIDMTLPLARAIATISDVDKVLAYSNGTKLSLGKPTLGDVTVTAKVLGVLQGPKLTVQKFRRRKTYRRRTGHRQLYTRVQIDKISGA